VPVITTADEPEALAVIEKTAREKNAPLIKVEQASRLFVAGETPALPLPGNHQKLNAALAVATVETLHGKIPVSDAAVRTGLETVIWPGRLQLVTLPNSRRILLDGAHNVAGAKTLREALSSWSSSFSLSGGTLKRELQLAGSDQPSLGSSGSAWTGAPDKFTLILGVLQDKDWRHICETLAPMAARIFTVPVASERTADARELAVACRTANPAAEIAACDSLRTALDRAANDRFVVITGSLYLVGEALELLGLLPATGDERALNEWSAHPQPLSTAG
jgi:dihydrofolate synthase/folylpolyglutamate synthase